MNGRLHSTRNNSGGAVALAGSPSCGDALSARCWAQYGLFRADSASSEWIHWCNHPRYNWIVYPEVAQEITVLIGFLTTSVNRQSIH